MRTITWSRGDGTVAVTTIFDDATDPAEHAAELLARGDVPEEYLPIAYDEELPPSSLPLEVYRAHADGRVFIDLEAAKVEAVKILEQRGVANAATLAQRATTVEDLEQELRSDRKG
jgi:hypothetical protein